MLSPGILPEPITFGNYYLLELVKCGGMAEVYRAKKFGAQGTEKQFAIKKILSHVAEEQGFIDMFVDEAKILAQLSHPNIVQIDELGFVEGAYCIVMEFLAGCDLKEIYRDAKERAKRLSIPQVCHIISEICDGLGYAHEKLDRYGKPLGIVHRDISPQNVIITYDGKIKLIDFGIAIAAHNIDNESNTNVLRGKYSYMSPEQIRGEELDARSDLFSLGVLMYELLTVARLFRGNTHYETLQNIHNLNIIPPAEVNPNISPELEAIVMKALAGDREERYQSAFEFRKAIERFLRENNYFYSKKELAEYMRTEFHDKIADEIQKDKLFRSWRIGPAEFHTPVESIDAVKYSTTSHRKFLDEDEENTENAPLKEKSEHTKKDDAWELLGLRRSQQFIIPPSPSIRLTGPHHPPEYEPYEMDESSFPELSDSGLKDFGIEDFQAYKSARYDIAAMEEQAAREIALQTAEENRRNSEAMQQKQKQEEEAQEVIKREEAFFDEMDKKEAAKGQWMSRLLLILIGISLLALAAGFIATGLLSNK